MPILRGGVRVRVFLGSMPFIDVGHRLLFSPRTRIGNHKLISRIGHYPPPYFGPDWKICETIPTCETITFQSGLFLLRIWTDEELPTIKPIKKETCGFVGGGKQRALRGFLHLLWKLLLAFSFSLFVSFHLLVRLALLDILLRLGPCLSTESPFQSNTLRFSSAETTQRTPQLNLGKAFRYGYKWIWWFFSFASLRQTTHPPTLFLRRWDQNPRN